MKEFVKLKIKTTAGQKTYWAEKLGVGRYREVNKDGEWGLKSKVHYIITAPQDIVWEKPAKQDLKYGNLTLETKMIKLKDLLEAGVPSKRGIAYRKQDMKKADPSIRRFLFAFVTHNKKYKAKAVRLGKTLSSPVEMVITNVETGKTETNRYPSEAMAKNHWRSLHKANLR